jgi:hypothetical protein
MTSPKFIFASAFDLMAKLPNGAYTIEVYTSDEVFMVQKIAENRYSVDVESDMPEGTAFKSTKSYTTFTDILKNIEQTILQITMILKFDDSIKTFVLY